MVVQENNKYTFPAVWPVDCFRAYDIRGATGEAGLTEAVAYAVGLAFGTKMQARGLSQVVVGRDGRLTGLAFKNALVEGLLETGCDVIDIGMVPTPLVYFATYQLTANSGVMVTASHNPGHHNGFKMVMGGVTVSMEGVQEILQCILHKNFSRKNRGHYSEYNIVPEYLAYIQKQVVLARPLKVVIDCGNGAGGIVAPDLFKALGCEVIELFCEVDGHFPNHHPDPSVPENLQDLIAAVKRTKADVGLAFDGDADRLGIVTNEGEVIWPDQQMMLFSMDVLSRQPGATIVFDVKCSRHLASVIRASGGNPVMYRTGHSLLKQKMFEEKAALAGEMSGHIFFCENWFGFDDGVYAGARLLDILARSSETAAQRFAQLPQSVNTPELKLAMPEDNKAKFMQQLLEEADFGEATLMTIDGLRVEFADSWGLIRPSNTSPYLILRFEADTEAGLATVQEKFRLALLKINPALVLPF